MTKTLVSERLISFLQRWFRDLGGEDFDLALEVGAEDDPFFIGRDADVGFAVLAVEILVVDVDEAFALDLAEPTGAEDVDPHAVFGESDLAGITAVTGEELVIARDVVMDG